MPRRYSWPSKPKGRPSSRMRFSAQPASGSDSDLVLAVASSAALLLRYRSEDALPDAIPRPFIGHLLLHGIDEDIDQSAIFGLGLRPDGFFGLAAHGEALRETLALLCPLQDPGDSIHLSD